MKSYQVGTLTESLYEVYVGSLGIYQGFGRLLQKERPVSNILKST